MFNFPFSNRKSLNPLPQNPLKKLHAICLTNYWGRNGCTLQSGTVFQNVSWMEPYADAPLFFFNVHVVFWEMKNFIICYHSPGQTSALTILHIKLTRSPCIKICREINVENVSFLAGVLEKQFFQSVIRCIIRGTSELLIIDSDNKNDSSRNRRVIVFRGVPQMFHIWLC